MDRLALVVMRQSRTRPWRRLAGLRASRRRHTELHPPLRAASEPEPLPPLECPDDDREFLQHTSALALRFAPISRPEPA